MRFQYEWHDAAGQHFRSYGNELWQFDPVGYMTRREASINDVAIEASGQADPRPATYRPPNFEGELPIS